MSDLMRPELLTPAEVASLLRVNPKTVSRWARAGILPGVSRTPGGHRRFYRTDVEALVARGKGELDETQGPDLTMLYRIWDATGALLYVGISTDVIRRLEEHARADWWPGADDAVVRLEGPYVPTRALAEEALAIHQGRPLHNAAR